MFPIIRPSSFASGRVNSSCICLLLLLLLVLVEPCCIRVSHGYRCRGQRIPRTWDCPSVVRWPLRLRRAGAGRNAPHTSEVRAWWRRRGPDCVWCPLSRWRGRNAPGPRGRGFSCERVFRFMPSILILHTYPRRLLGPISFGLSFLRRHLLGPTLVLRTLLLQRKCLLYFLARA